MKVVLAEPRGFCAGVDRAIVIVEKALERYGPPVYVRHEIVHNKHVVEGLQQKGAVFVEEVSEIPEGSIVVFSAHGSSKAIVAAARERGLKELDATCPLVTKVHKSIERYDKANVHTILIGHKNHPEVEGTMGQLAPGKITLVESVGDVEHLKIPVGTDLAYTTQTTLSVNETKDVIEALRKKYPAIRGPSQGDICYATTNRQQAVLAMTEEIDLLLIIGSKNSSNSNRLREIGEARGIKSHLLDNHREAKLEWFDGVRSIGISSGASAPDYLVHELVAWLKENFPIASVATLQTKTENVSFKLPEAIS